MHLDADVHARSQRERPGVRADDADILVPAQHLLVSLSHNCTLPRCDSPMPFLDVQAMRVF